MDDGGLFVDHVTQSVTVDGLFLDLKLLASSFERLNQVNVLLVDLKWDRHWLKLSTANLLNYRIGVEIDQVNRELLRGCNFSREDEALCYLLYLIFKLYRLLLT